MRLMIGGIKPGSVALQNTRSLLRKQRQQAPYNVGMCTPKESPAQIACFD